MPEGNESPLGEGANASEASAVGQPGRSSVSIEADRGIPSNQFYPTLVVGILFTFVGGCVAILESRYTPGAHIATLIACCGLGITLAAVGGRAVGTWKSWSVAGAAAAAPLLFLMQWKLQPNIDEGQIRGELQGTGRFQQITIWGHDSPFYVRKPSTDQNFQFVALNHQLSSMGKFFVTVQNEDGKTPKTFTIYCLKNEILLKHIGRSAPLELAIRADGVGTSNPSWFVYEGSKRFGKYNDNDCESNETKMQSVSRDQVYPAVGSLRGQSWLANLMVSAAYAQTSNRARESKDLMTALGSDSSDVRVAAQVDISRITQPDNLRTITDEWNVKSSSYRQDLGLINAWNTAIATDRAVAVRIAQAFSPAQIAYLAVLTGYPDQTLRYGATKLMSWFIQATAWPSPVRPDRARVIMDAVVAPLKSPSLFAGVRRDIKFEARSMSLNLLVALDWAGCLAVKVNPKEVQETLAALAQGKLAATNEDRVQESAKSVLEKIDKCPGS